MRDTYEASRTLLMLVSNVYIKVKIMFKKLLITIALSLSTSLWASPMDKVCLIDVGYDLNSVPEFIQRNCERNNIAHFLILEPEEIPYLVSFYCRFDRNVREGVDDSIFYLLCVLYDNKPRKY